MPTKRDNVKRSSPDGGKTLYIENPDLAARLKAKGVNAQAGKASGDRSKAKAKGRQYVERKRSSTPTKRTTSGGPNQSAQPVSRPQNVQGPLMQNGSYGGGATPPAQTFAQNGMNMRGAPQQPPYNPLPNYSTQPVRGAPPQPQYNPLPQQPMMQQRPSAFGQPNSTAAMGIQPMGNPYMNSQNPAQVMQGYQPPMNPWGRRW